MSARTVAINEERTANVDALEQALTGTGLSGSGNVEAWERCVRAHRKSLGREAEEILAIIAEIKAERRYNEHP